MNTHLYKQITNQNSLTKLTFLTLLTFKFISVVCHYKATMMYQWWGRNHVWHCYMFIWFFFKLYLRSIRFAKTIFWDSCDPQHEFQKPTLMMTVVNHRDYQPISHKYIHTLICKVLSFYLSFVHRLLEDTRRQTSLFKSESNSGTPKKQSSRHQSCSLNPSVANGPLASVSARFNVNFSLSWRDSSSTVEGSKESISEASISADIKSFMPFVGLSMFSELALAEDPPLSFVVSRNRSYSASFPPE